MQGAVLASSDRGGIRIQYSKNPFGRRDPSSSGASPAIHVLPTAGHVPDEHAFPQLAATLAAASDPHATSTTTASSASTNLIHTHTTCTHPVDAPAGELRSPPNAAGSGIGTAARPLSSMAANAPPVSAAVQQSMAMLAQAPSAGMFVGQAGLQRMLGSSDV